MKALRRTSLALGLLVMSTVSPQVLADEIWSGSTKITLLYPASSGMIFNTTYANTSLSSCDSGKRWVVVATNANYKAMVATLTAAFIAGKNVNLNITVNPPACEAVVNRFLVYE
jgi:hypothetical protein